MHGNTNFESKSATRKERNARPPRGTEQAERQPQRERGKQWTRENKRDQWQTLDSFQ